MSMGMEAIIEFFFCFGVFWIFVLSVLKYGDTHNKMNRHRTSSTFNNQVKDVFTKESIFANKVEYSELEIEDQIKKNDPDFNVEEFLAWVKNLYIKIQYAWSDRNIEPIRVYETPELFAHYQEMVQRYIDNKQINKIEKIEINWVKLFNFKQENGNDYITVLMNAKKIDYTINEETGGYVRGNKYDQKMGVYKLIFSRNSKIKTEKDKNEISTINCPNCGAPTSTLKSGKCSYCGSVIVYGNFSWVLTSLDPYIGATSKESVNKIKITKEIEIN